MEGRTPLSDLEPMRFAKLALVPILLAGCAAGPDGQRAQELLQQAQTANTNMKSATYVATLAFSGAGQKFELTMEGGALLKGQGAGDQFLRMRTEGLPAELGMSGNTMLMVKRGNQITLTAAGRTQVIPAPTELAHDRSAWGSLASLGLASCVEKVDVQEGRNLNGEPATRIAGTVDTGCLLRSLVKLSGLGSLAGKSLDTSKLGDSVGDIKATLFVSERSHLLIGGLVSIRAHAQGKSLDVQFSYRLTSVDEPVRFPNG
jgi:hypothetical protein